VLLTTLRLCRGQILVTATLLIALGVGFTIDGASVSAFIRDHRVTDCVPTEPFCDSLNAQVQQRYATFGQLLPYLGLLSAAVGAFWGAPLLSREYETGTAKLAWTQSVPRRSWMVAKVATLGGLVVVGGAALGLMVSGWLSVFAGFTVAGVAPDLSFLAVRGPAPAGWWLFGFAVGVAAGAVVRRTLGAIVITFAVVIVALALSNLFIAALAEPQLTVAAGLPLTDAVPPESAITSYTWIDRAGNQVTEEQLGSMTPNSCRPQDELAFQQCLYDLGYRAEVGYVTSGTRWRIELIRLGFLVGASVILLVGATWRVERAPA
jgi:ABC-type transport system involved in multi-copper enzyme maturation permease subunit